MGKKNNNRNVWFNNDNLNYIEEKAKQNNSNFNNEVNETITKERLETEKAKV